MANLLKSLYNKFEDKVLNSAPLGKVMVAAALRGGGGRSGGSVSLSDLLNKMPKNIVSQNLKKWKLAVAMATDPDNPDRTALWDLYDNMMGDDHLASTIDTRILHVQRSAFKLVNAEGDEDKEMTELLERPWFEELVQKVLMSRFQGCTLIEMFELNAAGELAEIEEIPQPYFNGKKGIILKNPGDTTGWSYREGVYSNYYFQVGKWNALGMFEKLAVIVLAKKLGLGSWLDYIENYGIPPLFITTDREDEDRIKELVEAAMKFKSSNFMVGRGQEKFEIGKMDGGATAPFESLLKRGDEQITKRVLGGSGIVDDKSFVGSAEIQFDLAKMRFASDKLLFKYIFNAEIKPRLIKISPVYAKLANLKFQWDDTESLTLQQLIDAIEALGAQFDIDPEYVTQLTGIPIIGTKSAVQPRPGGDGPKKR